MRGARKHRLAARELGEYTLPRLTISSFSTQAKRRLRILLHVPRITASRRPADRDVDGTAWPPRIRQAEREADLLDEPLRRDRGLHLPRALASPPLVAELSISDGIGILE